MKPIQLIMVDDDPADQEVFEMALNESGSNCEASFLSGGDELFEALGAGKQPDLIFLDLNMPLKDGREILRELKSTPKYRSIPVIIYTTSNSQIDIRLCYMEGASLYLTKPSDFTQIVSMVRALFALIGQFVNLPQKQ